MTRPSWPEWYLQLAHFVAQRSRDPSTKVGAVIVRADNTQVSFGFNDLARGVKHYPERYTDKTFKYPAIVHAEANAILNAREHLKGHTIYSTFHPCARCASLIVQSGLAKVVVPDEPVPDRWHEDMSIAFQILWEGGVELEKLDVGHP